LYVFCITQLLDTKASDKKMTLLHFIVRTVRDKFPDVANFDSELKYVEKASTGAYQSIKSQNTWSQYCRD